MDMDIQRARQILASPQWIDVTLEGESVAIDALDESSQTAQIRPIRGGQSRWVPVERLHET
jgi:H-type small acid-soluble spore protein